MIKESSFPKFLIGNPLSKGLDPRLKISGMMKYAFLWGGVFLFSVVSATAVDTTIKGGRMELINKGESVVFTGGVQLDRGPDRLESARMETTRNRDKVTAKGNVRLFRRVSSTETLKGNGEIGFYDTRQGAGYLLGTKKKQATVIRTEIISSTVARVVTVTADRIDFFRDTKRALATGAVKGDSADPETGDRYEFWSDEAEFDGEAKKITLSGDRQPLVIQTAAGERRSLRGDTIVYFTEQRRMTSEGNSRAVFENLNGKTK